MGNNVGIGHHPPIMPKLAAYNRSGATQAAAFGIYNVFDRVWCAGLLDKLKSYEIWGQIVGLISSFQSNRRWLQVVLNGKSFQENPVNGGVLQGFILGPALFQLNIINDLLDDVTSNIAISADDILDIWSVATTRIGFWTWIWSTRHCGLGQEVPCWFQCWKNLTGFIWPV